MGIYHCSSFVAPTAVSQKGGEGYFLTPQIWIMLKFDQTWWFQHKMAFHFFTYLPLPSPRKMFLVPPPVGFWREIDFDQCNLMLCIRQSKTWTHLPQGSSRIRRRILRCIFFGVGESWPILFPDIVNLHLIFEAWWILNECFFYLEWKRVEHKN